MNAEFFDAVADIEKEKGIPREYMYEKIRQAMLTAFRKDTPDCEDFSRALDPILDEADPIPDSYIFEVSSAGAERQLKRPGDFERFLGAQVEVRLYQPVDGSKVHIGTLEQYDNGDVTVSDGKTRRVFQKSAIAQVRLHLTI